MFLDYLSISYDYDFLEDFDIASYADDTKIYTTEKHKESVIVALETSSAIFFKWFNNNFMKVNNDESHLLVRCKEPFSAIIESSKSSDKAINQAKRNSLRCNDRKSQTKN